jgi:apolipoprotein N-acyltransferase
MMNTITPDRTERELSMKAAALLVLAASVTFQIAYTFPRCAFFIAVYLWCISQLARLKTPRQAAYFGLAAGLLTLAPQLNFFWAIFGPAAIALWYVCGFWIGVFVLLARESRVRFGSLIGVLVVPFLWTGLEYFRSELYYLRFSWLNAGYVFSGNLHWLPMRFLGMYGFGFVIMGVVSLAQFLKSSSRTATLVTCLLALGVLCNLAGESHEKPVNPRSAFKVAGVQMEFPSKTEVLFNLKKLMKAHPDADLIVLSEYTIDGPVPEYLRDWCRQNHRYLVVGAKDPAANSDYYDTAFVIGPNGETVFKQGKAVPVQFFKDGLPAKTQALWDSPWGKLGFCICYDLSYTRVTDKLIAMGAEAIIVPTMDVITWARHQHEMHARVAQVRAAEYGVPIFRVASSGISQCVDRTGQTLATAPMPGDGAIISGQLQLDGPGSLPLDRFVAPFSVWVTAGVALWLGIGCLGKRSPAKAAKPSGKA